MVYEKTCRICGCGFIGTGPAARYCSNHTEELTGQRKEKARLSTARHRAATGQIKMPGVGKGGHPHSGKDNPMYKHGLYVFETLRYQIKNDVRYCERCGQDLIEATHYKWVVHHKDHNHWNHELSNLEFLCKRCHQIEHECHLAFTKGATTSP